MSEEDLRERVQELEASVAGLTDELIECKTRLRDLEDASDADLAEVPTGDGGRAAADTEADTSNGEADDAAAESDPEDDQDSDDIIVA